VSNAVVWLAAGCAVGWLNMLSIRWVVGRLRPEAPAAALVWVTGSALVRWVSVALLLAMSVQHAAASGVLAFIGLGLSRWAVVLFTR
jgi:hypothetical protein